jgi:hypothetical protein
MSPTLKVIAGWLSADPASIPAPAVVVVVASSSSMLLLVLVVVLLLLLSGSCSVIKVVSLAYDAEMGCVCPRNDGL